MSNLKIDLDNILELSSEKKKNIIDKLNELILSCDDERAISKIGFMLVDNFKDESIEITLTKLIIDPIWKNNNGTFLYLLGEYTNDSKYLCFLIDLILNNENDGEILMGAYSMVLKLHPPFVKKDITLALQKLKRKSKKRTIDKERVQLISSLINFLEGQRDIIKFYSRFDQRKE
jgi:hypothetical protein